MRKKKEKKPDMMEILRAELAISSLELRLTKLVLPPEFEDSTKELKYQLRITAGALSKAVDALKAERMANDPTYAEVVHRNSH